MATTAKKAGIAGVAVGVLAAGAAAGFALERATIGRSLRRLAEPRRLAMSEPYGTLRGRPLVVRADDGTGLYVELDGPEQFSGGAGWARKRGKKGAGAAGQRPTLVFCHGYALTQDTWHFQRAEFAADYRCVFWDQRAHGRSDHGPAGSHTIDQVGRDLYSVLTAVCPDTPVVLVGHSMGGMTIMALAEAHPEMFLPEGQVKGVVLVSTTAGNWNEVTLGLPSGAAKLLHRTAPGVLTLLGRTGAIVDRGRRAGTDLAQLLTRRYAYASDVPAGLVRFTDEMLSSTPIGVIAAYFPTFLAHDKSGALGVLGRVPTEIVVGDHDLLTPVGHSEAILAGILEGGPVVRPGLEVVAEGGHVLPLEHPGAVDEAVRRVLGEEE